MLLARREVLSNSGRFQGSLATCVPLCCTTQTRQLMSERIRAAWSRRKATAGSAQLSVPSATAASPAASATTSGEDGASMPKALGRSLHEWTTAQLRAAVRASGQSISHPGPNKPKLFEMLTTRLAATGGVLVLGGKRQRKARDGSKDSEWRNAAIASAAPPADDAGAAPRVPAREPAAAAHAAAPAAMPPAPAVASAMSAEEKQKVLADALAEFLDATAGVRPLSSLFGEEILSEDGVGFLLAEGNMQDANTVAKFLRLKARFQELGE